MALVAEELRRAGFKCFVCPITKQRRLYIRSGAQAYRLQECPVAIVRTRQGWFVGKPYRNNRVEHPFVRGVYSDEAVPTPIEELQGKFISWKAAMACYVVTAGVQ